ncbi:MAG: phosphate ABC transporter ATP-binding protein [Anaerolineales bacterium]|nr:phosphate ABC transporter ATP-binding protein [Anaerolineales bacterium]
MINTDDQPQIVLRTHNLSRMVNGRSLVNNISIQVQKGDVLAIVGPSGAGKSSFLRLINRLDEPTSGTVFVHDQDYRDIPPRELRRRVGMVMQAPYLFPGTVADNLQFGPAQRAEQLSDDNISALLDQVGLSGFANRDISHLSGGEAQRVSLARTLANGTEILLLDEPTSALDDAAQQNIEVLLKRIIAQQNLTCLIITHDMDQAARLANRVLILKDGCLVQIGSITEVFNAKSIL